jgi:chemotaxis protein CheX
MHEELVIEAIQTATARVFSTMLGKELASEDPYKETENEAPSEGVIAQISLVGACLITSLVVCSADVACSIGAAMLMEDCPAVNAEVLDAMAEIANMIMGNVKTDLDAQLGEVNLSIPTVTYGLNFSVHNNSKRWIVVPFAVEEHTLLVKVCFEPAFEARRPLADRVRQTVA